MWQQDIKRNENNCFREREQKEGGKMDKMQPGDAQELEYLHNQTIKLIGELNNIKSLGKILSFVRGLHKHEKKANVHMQEMPGKL